MATSEDIYSTFDFLRTQILANARFAFPRLDLELVTWKESLDVETVLCGVDLVERGTRELVLGAPLAYDENTGDQFKYLLDFMEYAAGIVRQQLSPQPATAMGPQPTTPQQSPAPEPIEEATEIAPVPASPPARVGDPRGPLRVEELWAPLGLQDWMELLLDPPAFAPYHPRHDAGAPHDTGEFPTMVIPREGIKLEELVAPNERGEMPLLGCVLPQGVRISKDMKTVYGPEGGVEQGGADSD